MMDKVQPPPDVIIPGAEMVESPLGKSKSTFLTPDSPYHEMQDAACVVETQVPIPMLSMQNMELLQSNEAQAQELTGLELLHQVFDAMALNGRITMDQLPFVLAGAEVQATAEQVQEAIEEFLPDADDEEALLEFDQVQTLYNQLVQVVTDHAADVMFVANGEVYKPSIFRLFWRWLQKKHRERKLRQTAYERHMKPTTRLLLLILLTSCAISTAVVVFAVIFIFDQSNNATISHINRVANLISNTLNLFGYTRPFQYAANNLQQLSSMLSVVVAQLGYNDSRAYQLANLAYQRDLLGDVLDGWYGNDAATTVDTAVALAALWVGGLTARGMALPELVGSLNAINLNLPAGHELQLARSGAAGTVEFLTALRFSAGCVGTCGANNGSTGVRLALAGNNGSTAMGLDYRPQAVATGYRLLVNPAGIALVYNIWQTTLRTQFQAPVKTVVDAINGKLATEANSTADVRVNSQEIVLSTKLTGTTQNLTALRFCNASCVKAANLGNSYLALATNTTWQGTAADLDGEAVLMAYKPLPNSGMGLEVKVTQEEFLDNLYLSLGSSLDDVNDKLPGTEELQLVTLPKPGANVSTNGMKYWTDFQFASTCGSTCGTVPGTSAYLTRALTSCVSGTDHSLDYRSMKVVAGYFCVPAMKAAVSITVTDAQLIQEGTSMANLIASYESNVRYEGRSMEVRIGRKKAGVAVADIPEDIILISPRKFTCAGGECTGPSVALMNAVNGGSGYYEGLDYRWVETMGAYTYLPALDLGIVVKVDKQEAQSDSFQLTGILCGASVAAVMASMAVLALLANVLLSSMDRAWDEGKKAIEKEKQAFRSVIEAMYPAEVAHRMLRGETHIVYDVPAATVFFSDIYEFTTTSNTVTPEELIRFMGYTFGVMDAIGDYYHVYKVKTIGDAYLGVTGLPGVVSVNGNAAIDMLLFASACAQVFSNRFLHPDEGTILAEVVTRVLKKKNLFRGLTATVAPTPLVAIPKRPSLITYGHPKDAAGVAPAGEDGKAG
eukprot:EG_transcript_1905